MSKKHGKRAGNRRNRVPKGDVVWRQSAEEATLARKPYYNAFACGHGVHGDTKYNRAKEKRTWKRDLQKGASRGSFLLWQGELAGQSLGRLVHVFHELNAECPRPNGTVHSEVASTSLSHMRTMASVSSSQ